MSNPSTHRRARFALDTNNYKGNDVHKKGAAATSMGSHHFPNNLNNLSNSLRKLSQSSLNKTTTTADFFQPQRSPKLPSIYENYLKTNVMNYQQFGEQLNSESTQKVRLHDQSSVFHLPKKKISLPFRDPTTQDQMQKFLSRSTRRSQQQGSSSPLKQLAYSPVKESLQEEDTAQLNIDSAKNLKRRRNKLAGAQTQVNSPRQSINSLYYYHQMGTSDKATLKKNTRTTQPVCFCSNQQACAGSHNSLDNLVDLIQDQLSQVQTLNTNIGEESDYWDKSVKKIAYIRSANLQDHLVALIKEKDQVIQGLRSEVAKLIITKQDNDILHMQLQHLKEDSDFLREKLSNKAEQLSKIKKLDVSIFSLKSQLQAKTQECESLQITSSDQSRVIISLEDKLLSQCQANKELNERMQTLGSVIEKLQHETTLYKKYLDEGVQGQLNNDSYLVQKGAQLLKDNKRKLQTDVISKNFSKLENQVQSLCFQASMAPPGHQETYQTALVSNRVPQEGNEVKGHNAKVGVQAKVKPTIQ